MGIFSNGFQLGFNVGMFNNMFGGFSMPAFFSPMRSCFTPLFTPFSTPLFNPFASFAPFTPFSQPFGLGVFNSYSSPNIIPPPVTAPMFPGSSSVFDSSGFVPNAPTYSDHWDTFAYQARSTYTPAPVEKKETKQVEPEKKVKSDKKAEPNNKVELEKNAKSTKKTSAYVSSAKLGSAKNDKYFDSMLNYILSQEGGKVDDPLDRGGRTNMGVIQSTYDDFRRRHNLPKQDVYNITRAEARDIYMEFYRASGADKIDNPKMALMVFDFAIGSGVGNAKKMYKQSGGDINKFEKLRRQFYANIVKRDSSQKRFIKGWNNRVTHTMEFARKNLPDKALA